MSRDKPNSSNWNKTQSNSEEQSYDDEDDEDEDDDRSKRGEGGGNNSYLPEYPNIEVIRLEMDDEEDEEESIDELNLRYVLFKDRLIVSKNAFN